MIGGPDRRSLEEASLRAWPATEESRLDGWVLRYSGGFTGRANSVQALGGSPRSLEERVAECERWYAERRSPCLFRLSSLSEPGVEAFLESRGYQRLNRTLVLWRPLAPTDRGRGRAELVEVGLDVWLRCYASLTGLPVAPRPMAEIIARMEGHALLATLVGPSLGSTVACALAVLDPPFLGLFDLVVGRRERRKGYGQAMVRELLSWGVETGAGTAYLQVTEDNSAALALYEKLGFRFAYDYWYRRGPDYGKPVLGSVQNREGT